MVYRNESVKKRGIRVATWHVGFGQDEGNVVQ